LNVEYPVVAKTWDGTRSSLHNSANLPAAPGHKTLKLKATE